MAPRWCNLCAARVWAFIELAVRLRLDQLVHRKRRLLAAGRPDIVRRHAGNGAPWRHVVQHHASRRHAHAIADFDIAEDLGAAS